LAPSSTPL
jgi:hypothetical protein